MAIRRHPNAAIAVVALLTWLGLGLFGKLVAPTDILPQLLFLLILLLALTATFTPFARLLGNWLAHSKWYAQYSFRHALRQSALAALAVVGNLVLKILDAWFWPDIILIVLVIVLVEIIALARK